MSSTDTDTEPKRATIAKREWIDENGAHTPDRAKAVGARYTYLKSGNSLERVFGKAGDAATMCACMGWLTKVGNIVNSIVNADDYDGKEDPMVEIAAWDGDLGNGIWREASEGGAARGPKYDKDVLAPALVTVILAEGKTPAGDAAYYRAKLDDKSYYAKVRANTAVMAQYYKDLAAKGGAVTPQDASGLV